MSIILKAENISKQYRLGLVGTGTLSHDIIRWWHRIRGKEDPYLKVGAVNDRSAKASEEYVWALRDINFEVEEGEVLGIIGKNGAGKSTLLKILSRVTSPTTGEIKTRGRIASLLEVGTGFHPELTGRENIFLNGAILGMTKSEIRSKLDEIIDFSGCEMYIDTPVKRYSSGMRVRLAFAVAAHLEPDILVVDEVLAVGDAEFQKKAIGKMQDISRGAGRTVLFVSHNMASVEELCTRGLVLSNGKIVKDGNISDVVNYYRTSEFKIKSNYENKNTKQNNSQISRVSLIDYKGHETGIIKFGTNFLIKIEINVIEEIRNPIISCRISNSNNVNIVTYRTNDYINSPISRSLNKGVYFINLVIEGLFIFNDIYELSFSLLDGKEVLDSHQNSLSFEIVTNQASENYHILTKEKSTNSILFHEAIWKIYKK